MADRCEHSGARLGRPALPPSPSILLLTDRVGDPIAVDGLLITGLETADLKYEDGSVWRATLIKCERGVTFAVWQTFDEVYERWIEARGERPTGATPTPKAHPEAIGWELHPALSRPARDRKGDPLS